MDLLNIINEILENNEMCKIDELNNNLKLSNDLGFDSLMLAELTVKIEDETGIDIFEDGIVNTVGDILQKVNG